MPPCMFRDSIRNVVQAQSPLMNSLTEIDIFEPDGVKALIEAPEFLPYLPPHH